MADELTKSSQINTLLRATHRVLAEYDDTDTWLSVVEDTRRFLHDVSDVLDDQRRQYAAVEAIQVECDTVEGILATLSDGIDALTTEGRPHPEALEPIRDATAALFTCFDRLRTVEEAVPLRSRVAVLNQLLLYVDVYADGRGDADVLYACWERAVDHGRQFARWLINLPSAESTPEVDELMASLHGQVVDYQETLLLAEPMLADAGRLSPILEQARQLADGILDMHAAFIDAAPVKAGRPCFHCAARNDEWSRFCLGCGRPLLTVAAAAF